MTTCPYCTMTVDGRHELHCLMATRPIYDVPGAIVRIAERQHAAELAAYRERITKLEAVVTAQAAQIEKLRHDLADIAALADDGLAADAGAVYDVLYRIRDTARMEAE